MAADDLRPLQPDADNPAPVADLLPDDDQDGESYLIDEYADWDMWFGAAL